MKRLPIVLLALSALLLLGGCALGPSYRYSGGGSGGYYYGQSAYGNADTVIYGSTYANPWAWDPWYGGYYGPGWGYGRVGLGVTYTSHHYRHRPYRRVPRHHRQHAGSTHKRPTHKRPANRPPPVKAMRKAPRPTPRRLPQAQPRQHKSVARPAPPKRFIPSTSKSHKQKR